MSKNVPAGYLSVSEAMKVSGKCDKTIRRLIKRVTLEGGKNKEKIIKIRQGKNVLYYIEENLFLKEIGIDKMVKILSLHKKTKDQDLLDSLEEIKDPSQNQTKDPSQNQGEDQSKDQSEDRPNTTPQYEQVQEVAKIADKEAPKKQAKKSTKKPDQIENSKAKNNKQKAKLHNKIVDKATNRVTAKITAQIADKIVDKTIDKRADKVEDKTAGKMADKLADKVVDKREAKTKDKLVDKLVDKEIARQVDQISQDFSQDFSQNFSQDFYKDFGKHGQQAYAKTSQPITKQIATKQIVTKQTVKEGWNTHLDQKNTKKNTPEEFSNYMSNPMETTEVWKILKQQVYFLQDRVRNLESMLQNSQDTNSELQIKLLTSSKNLKKPTRKKILGIF